MHGMKFADLKAMSIDELTKQYDLTTPNVQIGLNFIREEIARRETDAQNQRMIEFTKQVRDMTVAITVLTVAVALMTAINIYLVA
ncbi:hypothetical protein [Mesorhizobium sp. 43Arga]